MLSITELQKKLDQEGFLVIGTTKTRITWSVLSWSYNLKQFGKGPTYDSICYVSMT